MTVTTANGDVTLGIIDGGQTLTINAGTGGVTLGVVGANTTLTSLTVTGGTITLSNVTTSGAQSYTGSATLNGSGYTTSGAAFTVTGASTLGSGVTVTTANGDVTLGIIDGANALTVSAGTGDVTLGIVGATTALTGLTVTGGTITLSNVTTNGAQSYTGTTSLSSTYVTGSGTFAINGTGTLTTTTAITTTNAGLSFNGTLEGAQSLTLSSGTGAITFAGTVGSTAQPVKLTIASAGDVTVQASMKVGTFVQNSGTGTTDFGNSSLTANGDITVSTKNIKGVISGNTVSLLATDTVAGTIAAINVIVSGNSVVLSGKIGGTDGKEVAQQIGFNGSVGSGPYTFNGFSIFPGVLVASNGQTFSSGIADEANSQSATVANADQSIIAGSLTSGAVNKPANDNPGQLAFGQDWTFRPAVANVFDTSFALVTVETGGVSADGVELAIDVQDDIQGDAELTDTVLQDDETQAFLGDIWSYVSQSGDGI